jgi:DNA-binding response OmpR family regulator
MANILIVEDDQFIQKMYAKKFQVEGFTVQTANNGDEGLAALSSFSPDIILLDLMMPKLDGFGFIEKIKQDEKHKHIPIVVATNLSTTTDAVSAVKKGAVDYIVKSDVTPGQVVEKIKKNLQSPKKS